MLSQEDRRQIDQNVQSQSQLMILTAQTDLARGLRSFWNRSIPIWEGHTRNALADFVSALDERAGNAEAIAAALAAFVSTTAKGFSESSHGRRLIQEVRNGCAKSTTGKPANIQLIAKCVLEFPDHRGASAAIRLIGELINQRAAGFDAVYIDYRTEFNEAKQLDRYPSAQGAFAEISRKRAYVRPSPPSKTISSIHKAKGLECDHSMLIPCDDQNFRDTPYKRCMLYVALTRAKHSLRLVVPRTNPSPLIRLS
jgi:DNA helicase-2/ATP-dependent DNA helicase PcrA